MDQAEKQVDSYLLLFFLVYTLNPRVVFWGAMYRSQVLA